MLQLRTAVLQSVALSLAADKQGNEVKLEWEMETERATNLAGGDDDKEIKEERARIRIGRCDSGSSNSNSNSSIVIVKVAVQFVSVFVVIFLIFDLNFSSAFPSTLASTVLVSNRCDQCNQPFSSSILSSSSSTTSSPPSSSSSLIVTQTEQDFKLSELEFESKPELGMQFDTQPGEISREAGTKSEEEAIVIRKQGNRDG